MEFLKYLTLNNEDLKIGLNVLHAGFNEIKPYKSYPFPGHPSNYLFQWENGRRFNEFQVNYIITGSGFFESHTGGKIPVKAGSIILLFPNEWHRYRPATETGWAEYWVGFSGEIADNLLKQEIITRRNPVLEIGFNEKVFKLYQELIELVKEELPGYQIIVAGMVMQILGLANSLIKVQDFQDKETEKIVNEAKILLIKDLSSMTSPEVVAQSLDVGYSRFRKLFKQFTGLAPGQFQMQHRIIKAKEMLSFPGTDLKQVAFQLGFESASHFNKIFKEKTGLTPGKYRRSLLNL